MFAPYDLISLPTAQAEMDLPQLRCGEEAEDDGSSIVKEVQYCALGPLHSPQRQAFLAREKGVGQTHQRKQKECRKSYTILWASPRLTAAYLLGDSEI
jgi:hypothetical protein